VTGRGQYTELTRRNNSTIKLWCNTHCDLLVVWDEISDPSTLDLLNDTVGVRHVEQKGNGYIIITETCLLERTDDFSPLDPYIQKHNCIYFEPTTYEQGTKDIWILATKSNLQSFTDDIEDDFDVKGFKKTEIWKEGYNARVEIPFLRPYEQIPKITERQYEILERYYDPDESETGTVGEIAEDMNLHHTTVSEHLNTARDNIITGLLTEELIRRSKR
jgi:predicted DNA binding protein